MDSGRLSISAKIWLSIGIFVVGFISSTLLIQIQGLAREAELRLTSQSLFPAAQKAQDAETAFQTSLRAFRDAVVMQESSTLERAAQEGSRAVDDLHAVASIKDLPSKRNQSATALSFRLRRFLRSAQ